MTDPQPIPDHVPVSQAPRQLSREAQHVCDMLEGHLKAMAEAVKHGTPATLVTAQVFAQRALKALADFGGSLRGGEDAVHADLDAAALSQREREAAAAAFAQANASTANGRA